jgi:hypothetical protein
MHPAQIAQGQMLFFGFQNALRLVIQHRFNQVRGYDNRQGQTNQYHAELPKHLHHQIDAMIACDMAALLWSKKMRIPVSQEVANELKHLHSLLAHPAYNWEMQIGHVIPRNP